MTLVQLARLAPPERLARREHLELLRLRRRLRWRHRKHPKAQPPRGRKKGLSITGHVIAGIIAITRRRRKQPVRLVLRVRPEPLARPVRPEQLERKELRRLQRPNRLAQSVNGREKGARSGWDFIAKSGKVAA